MLPHFQQLYILFAKAWSGRNNKATFPFFSIFKILYSSILFWTVYIQSEKMSDWKYNITTNKSVWFKNKQYILQYILKSGHLI